MLRIVAICSILSPFINYCAAEVYAIRFDSNFYYEDFDDAPAAFGGKLTNVVRGMLQYADPPDACNKANPPPKHQENDTGKWILLIPRSTPTQNCSFGQKVRVAQKAGYDAVIVHNVDSNELITMRTDNDTGIVIPSVFVSATAGDKLLNVYTSPRYFIVITGDPNMPMHLLIPFAIVVGICFIIMLIFMVVKCVRDRRRQHRHRLPTSTLNKIPTCKYQKGDPYDTCAICLDDYIEGEKLRVLPCNHVYHTKCIDPWLTKNRRVCPICKRKVFAHDETHHYSDSESETDETTPLINSNNRGTQGRTFIQQRENPLQRAARSISQQSGAGTIVTASDRHSINGEYHEQSSDSSSYEGTVTTSNGQVLDDSLGSVVVQPNDSASANSDLHV